MNNQPISQQLQEWVNITSVIDEKRELIRIIQQVKELEEQNEKLYEFCDKFGRTSQLEEFEAKLINNPNKYLLKHEIIELARQIFGDKK